MSANSVIVHLMEIENLKNRIAELEKENEQLLRRNLELEGRNPLEQETPKAPESDHSSDKCSWECDHDLTKAQVERYSRQLVLSSFGPQGMAICNGLRMKEVDFSSVSLVSCWGARGRSGRTGIGCVVVFGRCWDW